MKRSPWHRVPHVRFGGQLTVGERRERLARKAHGWGFHPGVRSGDQLSFGERAADAMRSAFGSWTFIGATLLFIAVWILLVIYVKVAIDNHQLTILNLILSCFAAMQGAIILLAAKRADAISSELAQHTYENGVKLLDLNTAQLAILNRLDGLTDQVAKLTRVTRAASPDGERGEKLGEMP